MSYLIDSNCLLLLAQPLNTSTFQQVETSIQLLETRNERLCVTTQNVAEFWTVATRPRTARGGLGLAVSDADRFVLGMAYRFELLAENMQVYNEWRRLIVTYGVTGVATHDARIAAAMLVNRIDHILTFDTSDFARYAPQIQAVAPESIT